MSRTILIPSLMMHIKSLKVCEGYAKKIIAEIDTSNFTDEELAYMLYYDADNGHFYDNIIVLGDLLSSLKSKDKIVPPEDKLIPINLKSK